MFYNQTKINEYKLTHSSERTLYYINVIYVLVRNQLHHLAHTILG